MIILSSQLNSHIHGKVVFVLNMGQVSNWNILSKTMWIMNIMKYTKAYLLEVRFVLPL